MANHTQHGGVPKCLLRFGSRSLLDRHIGLLRGCGVEDVHVAVGYEARRIQEELARLPGGGKVGVVFNPDFHLGSIVTLWRAKPLLKAGRETLLMDADVLYDQRLLRRLLASPHDDCLLLDRNFEADEEPVKVCIRAGRIVEFRKQLAPDMEFDFCGESVGFFRLSPATCRELAEWVDAYVTAGRKGEPHEEALRELMLDRERPPFGVEDVTGIPWVEIDFPEDVRVAEEQVFPCLHPSAPCFDR